MQIALGDQSLVRIMTLYRFLTRGPMWYLTRQLRVLLLRLSRREKVS